MEKVNFPLLQCGTLELDQGALKRLERLQMTLDLCSMDALKLGFADADDADLCKLTTSKLTLTENDIKHSDSDSDSGYDLGEGEEDCSLASASVDGSLSSRSSITGGSTESLHLASLGQQPGRPLRFAVLSHEQVRRLHDVINDTVFIHGRGNFPTLELRLRDLVTVVRNKLELDHVTVKDIRLNGGAASYVLATDDTAQPYNDLDLIFAVDMSSARTYDRIKSAVLDSLLDFLPAGVARTKMLSCSLKEAYVSKMVKVTEGDRWSLISLGNHRGKNIELKFVHNMRRQFEFSVDSFQIILDSLLLFYDCAQMPISDTFYPTVLGESVYGDFREALCHLENKMIATRNPEEIRGGGLLKYCNLLVKEYHAAKPDEIKTLERYMCSRFFIDFPDVAQQRSKLENYLWNHFIGSDESLKYDFLMILYNVVDESTVCLMGHERRQTLSLIEELACQIYYAEQHQHAPPPTPFHAPVYEVRISGCQPTVVYSSAGYFYAPMVTTPTSVPPPPTPNTSTVTSVPPTSPATNVPCHPCNCCWMPCS